jgi:DNA-binding response OmpR family regulator
MKKTIIIIEGEPDIRDYLTAVLEDKGYTICTVRENKNVIDAVRSHNPDLIILDIMMPQRSGISIYKELRTTHDMSSIPIAMLSGISQESDLMRDTFHAYLLNESIPPPDGFIEKPLKIPSLEKTIELLIK